MVTCTQLLKTQDIYDTVQQAIKAHGAWSAQSPKAAEWNQLSDQLVIRLEKDLRIFEKEEAQAIAWMAEAIKNCQQMCDEARAISVTVTKEPWKLLAEKARMDQIRKLFDTKIAGLAAARVELKNHQGFRGNLGLPDGTSDKLLRYQELFTTRRKVWIDKLNASSLAEEKAKTEYVARFDQAQKLVAESAKGGDQKLRTMHNELEQLRDLLANWKDDSSANYAEINKQKKKMDNYIDNLSANNANADTVKATRLGLKPLEDAINATKARLNTDYKRLESIFEVMGKALKDSRQLDQKLVASVSEGFADVRKTFQTLYADLEKAYEKRIKEGEKKLEKKLKKA